MKLVLFAKSICIFIFVCAMVSHVGPAVLSQTDDSPPLFRPRTDPNSVGDLQLLRDELNKATDTKGAVNPLGNFLQRNAQPAEPASLRIGPNVSDNEPDSSNVKTRKGIEMLPGPRYTIIQQARPQSSNAFLDGFRPARFVSDFEANVRPSLQDPVAFASADIPIAGQPKSYIANYQDIPYGATGTPAPFIPPSSNIPPNNPQPFPTVLPFPSGGAPQNNFGVTPPTYSTPIPNNVPIGTTNIAPLNNSIPYYGGVPMRSPSESIMPNYPRSSSIVNSAPFVSSPPCQFDASYMVSRSVYRQSVDPCAQPARGAANAYAPFPYATQPGASPFSYVPPTAMSTSNNGYNSGYRSLIGFGQTLNNAYLGRGIIGQPTAYVDGQPFRNFFRYIFP